MFKFPLIIKLICQDFVLRLSKVVNCFVRTVLETYNLEILQNKKRTKLIIRRILLLFLWKSSKRQKISGYKCWQHR